MKYNELRENLKDDLNSRFNMLLALGQNQEAYNILGELMRFGLISKDDERLSDKYMRAFKKAGVDIKRRFDKDMRKYDNGNSAPEFLPDNLFEKEIPLDVTVTLTSKRHWTKRRELQYIGDIVSDERDITCQFALAKTSATVKRAIEDICKVYLEEKHKSLTMNTYKENMTGQQKIYRIVLGNGQHFLANEFGFVIIDTFANGVIYITIVMRDKLLYDRYIPIKQTYERVLDAITSCLDIEANSEKLKVRYLTEPRRLYKKQQAMLEDAGKSNCAKEVEMEVASEYSV